MAPSSLVALGTLLLFLTDGPAAAFARLDSAEADWMGLCQKEVFTSVSCSLEPPGIEPCSVYLLPEDHCFQTWPECRSNRTFNETDFKMDYDPETHLSNVTIWNYNERRLLLTTKLPNATSWQLDIPAGEHNITITGLPAFLNETNYIIQPKYCEGCPTPRMQLYPVRKQHVLRLIVSPINDNLHTEDHVSILMATSNETNFFEGRCDSLKSTYIYKEVARGITNEELHVEGVYSTEFCFVINVNYSSTHQLRRYICSPIRYNMSVLPVRPYLSRIEAPTGWTVAVASALLVLLLLSIAPCLVHRGLLPSPCGRRRRPPCREDERHPRPQDPFLTSSAVEILTDGGELRLNGDGGVICSDEKHN